MSSQYWIDSAALPGTSSGGLLRLDSAMLCDLWTLSESEGAGDAIHATFQGTVNSPTQYLDFVMAGRGESDVKRWMGCMFMACMPDGGLDDALTSLKDVLEFALEDMQVALPAAPEAPRVSGKATSPSERPELVIAE